MRQLLTFVSLLPMLFVPAGFSQDDSSEQEKRLEEIEKQLEENNRDAEEIKQIVPQREEELRNLRDRLIETADSLKETEQQVTNLENRLAGLEEEQAEVQEDLIQQQADISNVLAALQSLEWSKPPALAVSPDDASKAARAAMALSSTVPDLQKKVDQLNIIIERNNVLQADLLVERRAVTQARSDLDSRNTILENLLNQKEDEFKEVNQRLSSLERENKLLADEATTIRELMRRLADRETLSSTNPIDATPADLTLTDRPQLDFYLNLPRQFTAAKGKLPFPVAGRISEKYGSKTEAGEALEGLRIETRSGAIVTTPFGGEVVFAEVLGRLGHVFILDVGENYHILMIGLVSLDVAAGEKVKAGEPIGYMPSIQDREQLTFQIRRNSEPLNPTSWFLPEVIKSAS